jgi:hypothetical protein
VPHPSTASPSEGWDSKPSNPPLLKLNQPQTRIATRRVQIPVSQNPPGEAALTHDA